jgi:hypothetical protein
MVQFSFNGIFCLDGNCTKVLKYSDNCSFFIDHLGLVGDHVDTCSTVEGRFWCLLRACFSVYVAYKFVPEFELLERFD